MQLIVPDRASRPPIGAVIVGTAVGAVLLIGGVALGLLAFTTPVLTGFTSAVRPTPAQLAIGAAVWGVALVAPASFAIVGALRLGHVARSLAARPPVRAITRAADALGDEYVAATNVRLPDGRLIRDLVLGPFGLAVLTELPAAANTRHRGSNWELRRHDGRWVHFENPLERTARDGERIRGWIAATERDFVVKVFAVVITTDPSVTRTATCAVIAPDQIAAWLTSLPAARAMTADRRADLVEEIRRLV